MISLVIDTSVLIRALLTKFDTFDKQIVIASIKSEVKNYASSSNWHEIQQTLQKSGIAKRIKPVRQYVDTLLFLYYQSLTHINPQESICICRDVKDNHILETAIAADTSFIITNDLDLLILNPLRKIQIIRPREFFQLKITQPTN